LGHQSSSADGPLLWSTDKPWSTYALLHYNMKTPVNVERVFSDKPVTLRPFPRLFARDLPNEHIFSASPAPPSAVALQTPFPATTITP